MKGSILKFFRREAKVEPPTELEPMLVLEQKLTLADALLTYYDTGCPESLRSALIKARGAQKREGADLMFTSDLVKIRRETLAAAKVYYVGRGLPSDSRLEKIITFERAFERMSSVGMENEEEIAKGLKLIAETREALGDSAPNIIDYLDDIAMLEAKVKRLESEIEAGLKGQSSWRKKGDAEEVAARNEELAIELIDAENSLRVSRKFLKDTEAAFKSNLSILKEAERGVRRLGDLHTSQKQQELVNSLKDKLSDVTTGSAFDKLAEEAEARLQGMREVQEGSNDYEFTRLTAQERLEALRKEKGL
jgi:hypothetical protein